MKRLVVALPLVAVLSGLVTTASATNGSLPGGTALSVAITTPLTGSSVTPGTPITVTGTASVAAGMAVKNTDLVFVLDTSGSTGNTSNINCDGNAGNDTILTCEKQAVRNLVTEASSPNSSIANVGAAAFPAAATLSLAPPEIGRVNTYLNLLGPGSGTDFSVGIAAARSVLADSEADTKLIVLLTDGDGSSNPGEAEIEAVVLAFTIAGRGCTDVDLQRIVDLGLDGSECETVTDLGSLSSVISDSIGSSLTGVSVNVDGGPAIATTVTPALPVSGPANVTFSATVPAGLTSGAHSICASASGTDAGGSAAVSDCVTVNVLPPGSAVVDCGAVAGTCQATATDTGKSNLAFSAPTEFNEQVVITPNAGGTTGCQGSSCVTGYDVAFPTTTANGPIASITVITANKVSLRDRLNAAVFIDGTRITAQCSNRLLKFIRDKLGRPEPIPCITISYKSDGRLEYFVKFRADPAFRFR